MHTLLTLMIGALLMQDRPLPVPMPPALENAAEPKPLEGLSGWFVASDPYGPSAILRIEAAGDEWTARIITRSTTEALGQTWCDITAVEGDADRQPDGVQFIAQGASVDAGPRWSPNAQSGALRFGVIVFEREAVVTDMGVGQALCGPRSELTGLYSRMPD